MKRDQAAGSPGHSKQAILAGVAICAVIVTGCLSGGDGSQSTQPAPPPAAASVTGTVTYPELVDLAPPSAVVAIQLVETSADGALAVALGERIGEPTGRLLVCPCSPLDLALSRGSLARFSH